MHLILKHNINEHLCLVVAMESVEAAMETALLMQTSHLKFCFFSKLSENTSMELLLFLLSDTSSHHTLTLSFNIL